MGEVLVANISALSFLKAAIPQHIPHRFSKEMAQKSTIVSLPIQLKDEKKYDDVVDILCFYENTLEEIYSKAGQYVSKYWRKIFFHMSSCLVKNANWWHKYGKTTLWTTT